MYKVSIKKLENNISIDLKNFQPCEHDGRVTFSRATVFSSVAR